MALLVENIGFAGAWRDLLRQLLMKGNETSPRGRKTREILNVTFHVNNGRRNILHNQIRDLNYRFMIAEWLWIQAGLDDVESLALYNSIMRKFSDDNVILSGAYGPRLAPQWSYIVAILSKLDTRQAVSVIWTPCPKDSKDIPCTISLQWMIRDADGSGSKLHCTVNMRSSDVWLGLPYDFFTFSQLTNNLGALINYPVGSITMNLASSHIYEEHFEIGTSALLTTRSSSIESPPLPRGIYPPTKAETVEILRQRIPHDQFEDTVWGKYALALTQNKQHALEVLVDISPTRTLK